MERIINNNNFNNLRGKQSEEEVLMAADPVVTVPVEQPPKVEPRETREPVQETFVIDREKVRGDDLSVLLSFASFIQDMPHAVKSVLQPWDPPSVRAFVLCGWLTYFNDLLLKSRRVFSKQHAFQRAADIHLVGHTLVFVWFVRSVVITWTNLASI